ALVYSYWQGGPLFPGNRACSHHDDALELALGSGWRLPDVPDVLAAVRADRRHGVSVAEWEKSFRAGRFVSSGLGLNMPLEPKRQSGKVFFFSKIIMG